MYAIIESCGKQYKVAEGDVVFFEKLDVEEGKKVTFDKVVLVSEDKKVEVGAPYVKGVKVEGKVVSHGKGKKVLVYKYKAKKNYRRTQGHRQPYTKVEITKIKTAAEKAETKTEAKAETKTAPKAMICTIALTVQFFTAINIYLTSQCQKHILVLSVLLSPLFSPNMPVRNPCTAFPAACRFAYNLQADVPFRHAKGCARPA